MTIEFVATNINESGVAFGTAFGVSSEGCNRGSGKIPPSKSRYAITLEETSEPTRDVSFEQGLVARSEVLSGQPEPASTNPKQWYSLLPEMPVPIDWFLRIKNLTFPVGSNAIAEFDFSLRVLSVDFASTST
jgi:hypothetical protein